ncbi:MAG: methyltransferase, partial [Cyanobium sp.]
LGSDHPQSLRQFARMLGAEHYLSWDDLLHSLRTGENAFRHRHGCSVFAWYERHPERGAIFDGAMGDFSRPETEAVLAAFDFSAIGQLVDEGGGRVLIHEQVIPPGNEPFPGKLLDLHMLVMTEGGRERTPGEYALLLESAGLNLRRIHPTASAVSVVEAVAG